jgi:hypothetical protein
MWTPASWKFKFACSKWATSTTPTNSKLGVARRALVSCRRRYCAVQSGRAEELRADFLMAFQAGVPHAGPRRTMARRAVIAAGKVRDLRMHR